MTVEISTPPKQVRVKATQSLKELQEVLGALGNATCQVNLIKSTKKPSAKNSRFLDMKKALADHFKERTASNLQAVISDASTDVEGISAFDHQAFADGRLAALPIAQFPEVKAWFEAIPAPDVVTALKADDNHVDRLKFTVTILTFSPKGDTVRVFRKASSSSIAKKGIIASLVAGTEYDYVDPGTTLIFDMKSDFFVWDNTVFVENYRSLESILNFREITQTVAHGVCDQIFAALPVSDAAGLRAAILSGNRQVSRIARLKTKPHIPMLDMEKVAVVVTKAKLPLTISKLNGRETLVVDADNPEQISAFLHVLSDDYVKSMMTDLEYVTEYKDVLGG